MQNDSHTPLLSEFEPATREAWKAAAEALLKGAPFEKKLLTPTPEGITLQPLYFREDAEGLAHLGSFPGAAGYVRGYDPAGGKAAPWEIAQELPEGTPEGFNKVALGDLMRGQNALRLVFDQPTLQGRDPDEGAGDNVGRCGTSVATAQDMGQALSDIVPNAVSVSMKSDASALPLAALLAAAMQETGRSPSELRGCLGADPLAALARDGTLPRPLVALYNEMAALVLATEGADDLRVACVSGLPVADAGGSAVEELASCLATGLAYLRALGERGVSPDTAAGSLEWEMSLGSSFFMEIAKLRAARLLWTRVATALGVSEEAARLRLSVRTGHFNKSALDPYVNMLRTTTEALSGAVAGVQSMTVAPFDEVVRGPGEFSRRIARNTQIILQEECNLLDVIDPAGGSWFLEKLTDELAGKAWSLFQEIEKQGGMAAALEQGLVQEIVSKTAATRKQHLAQRRSSLIGVNIYPNAREKPLEAAAVDYQALAEGRKAAVAKHRAERAPGVDTLLEGVNSATVDPESLLATMIEAARAGATLGELSRALAAQATGKPETVEPLAHERAAQMFERLRTASGTYAGREGHPPLIHLANIGPLRKHKLRMDFTAGFFEVGGFELRPHKGTTDVSEAVKACVDSGALLTVICGTDDDYTAFVPEFCRALKAIRPDIAIILAGYPGDNEAAWREAGLDDYIFIKSNVLDTNTRYLKALGAL